MIPETRLGGYFFDDQNSIGWVLFSISKTHDPANGDLRYTWYDGAEWHYETVDSGGRIGTYTSLALDAWEQPHISYYDDINADLKYARTSLPLRKRANPSDRLHNDDPLTYTLTLFGPGLNVNLWDPLFNDNYNYPLVTTRNAH